MIVPRFWAEASLQRPRDRSRGLGQITLRRFGWSNESQQAAQALAAERVAAAMARVDAGDKLDPREPKVPYNGADGVPIREEIIEEFENCAVTRNAYGALCLNTPDVLFGDIDIEPSIAARDRTVIAAGGVGLLAYASTMISFGLAFPLAPDRLGYAVGLAFGIAAALSAYWAGKRLSAPSATADDVVKTRIAKFLETRPGWRIRLYRTPKGYRFIVMNRKFQAQDPEVADCFRSLLVDPVYARMCQHQACFRARLTAKPWRIGVGRLRPNPGVWPVHPDRIQLRTAWVDEYNSKATKLASCRFLLELGTGPADGDVIRVRDFHDAQCSALTDLPLA